MKETEGRWLRRKSAMEPDLAKTALVPPGEGRVTGGPTHSTSVASPSDLRRRIRSAAFAFRGFDVENVGRGAELLDHPVYGPIVGRVLGEASELCSESIHVRVDLASHIRAGGEDHPRFFSAGRRDDRRDGTRADDRA